MWGFAGCHSLSRENLYFHVLEVPDIHLFEDGFRCGFQCVFLAGFIRFSMILGGTLTPCGLPWAGHLLAEEHLCQDRCKGRLQAPKRVTFRRILGAIWEDFGDISDDLGCILNTPFLGILFVFITYFFGIHRVFFSYSLSFLELFSKYFLGIA